MGECLLELHLARHRGQVTILLPPRGHAGAHSLPFPQVLHALLEGAVMSSNFLGSLGGAQYKSNVSDLRVAMQNIREAVTLCTDMELKVSPITS